MGLINSELETIETTTWQCCGAGDGAGVKAARFWEEPEYFLAGA